MRLNIFSRLSSLVVLFLVANCNSVFYQPSNHIYSDPEKLGLKFEDFYFQSYDETRIHGRIFYADNGERALGTVVQLHGNAENLTSHYLSMCWLVKKGYNLFIFDYRGYGHSSGQPARFGVRQDAVAALDLIRNMPVGKRGKKIIVHGQSLGGVIAMEALLQTRHTIPVDGLILESTFLSYREVAREVLSRHWLTWAFQPLGYILITEQGDLNERLQELAPVPILVVHGTGDALIPFRLGQQVYDAAGSPKRLLTIAGGSHINSFSMASGYYREAYLKFLESL